MPSTSLLTDKIERQLADGTTRPIHYLAGIVIPLLAAALQAALRSALDERYHFVLFYPAVMVAAWYGGLRPGLLATALSAALPIGFFLPSHDPHGYLIVALGHLQKSLNQSGALRLD
jgi:K+-sensing histidine kinase KdpD